MLTNAHGEDGGHGLGTLEEHLNQQKLESPNLNTAAYWQSKGLLGPSGKPRLAFAKSYFLDRHKDYDELESFFNFWSGFEEFMVLTKDTEHLDGSHSRVRRAVKCAKRGNDVYNYRLHKRIRILDHVQDEVFFEWDSKKPTTKCLAVTLTYNTNLCSVYDAWLTVGQDWNRWISRVRRRLGVVRVLRVWEAFENGYPHVHAILVFQDAEFPVFMAADKDGKLKVRIQDKKSFEGSWHSFVDVEGVRTLRGAFGYIKKYLTKVHQDSDSDDSKYCLTLSMMWLFKKRAYAVSRDFVDLIERNCVIQTKKPHVYQVDLEGKAIPSNVAWYFEGIFSREELGSGYKPDRWTFELDRIPDVRHCYQDAQIL